MQAKTAMAHDAPDNGVRWVAPLILLGIAGVGFALRWEHLNWESLWWDELSSWIEAEGTFDSPHSAPAYPLLVRTFSALLGGPSELAVRLPSVLFGTAAIFMTYLLAREILGSRLGLLAAALLAFSPFAIFTTRTGRPYALFQFLVAVLLFCWLRAKTRPDVRRWASYSAAVAACCLTHLLTAQVLLAVGAAHLATAFSVGTQKKAVLGTLWRFAAATVLGSLVGLFWILWRTRIGSVFEGAYNGTLYDFIHTYLDQLGPGISNEYHPGVRVLSYLSGTLAAVGLLSLWRRNRPSAWALGLLFAVSFVVLYGTLGHKGNWPWQRYFAHLSIPWCILLASGFGALAQRFVQPPWQGLALAFAPLIMLPGLNKDRLRYQSFPQSSWRAAFQDMARLSRRGGLDGVVLYCVPQTGIYGDESERFLAAYRAYGRNLAPTWFARGRQFRRIDAGADPAKQLPPGDYAVVTRDEFANCGMVHGLKPFRCQQVGGTANRVEDPRLARHQWQPRVFPCRVGGAPPPTRED